MKRYSTHEVGKKHMKRNITHGEKYYTWREIVHMEINGTHEERQYARREMVHRKRNIIHKEKQ